MIHVAGLFVWLTSMSGQLVVVVVWRLNVALNTLLSHFGDNFTGWTASGLRQHMTDMSIIVTGTRLVKF